MPISIFILPPTKQELEKRLRRRSSAERMTDEAVIKRRLETATREIEKYTGIRLHSGKRPTGRFDRCAEGDHSHRASPRRRSGALREPTNEKLVELAESRRLERVRPTLGPILESFRKKTE